MAGLGWGSRTIRKGEMIMKITSWLGFMLLPLSLLPNRVWANEFYNRAPGFEVPAGTIAYMGSYFNPLRVHENGSDTQYLRSVQRDFLGIKTDQSYFVAEKGQAVNETNQSLQEKAAEMKLSLNAVPFNEAYQNALLMHVLTPAKYLYNPGITQFCGNQPYILIVVIDYYAEFACSINIRESQNGQKINYLGRRSIIEKDLSLFKNKGRQGAVALEFYLVSTKDGSTVWQANTITTVGSMGANYYNIAKGLSGDAFKNLMKQ